MTINVDKENLYNLLDSQNIESINYNITWLGILVKHFSKKVNINLNYTNLLPAPVKQVFQLGINYN